MQRSTVRFHLQDLALVIRNFLYTLFLKSNHRGPVATYKLFLDAGITHFDRDVNPQTQRNTTNYVQAILKDIKP